MGLVIAKVRHQRLCAKFAELPPYARVPAGIGASAGH